MPQSDWQQAQQAFSEAVRERQQTPPEGIEARRLNVYRELIYNNIQSFCARAFPVLKSLLGPEVWHALIDRFLREHRAQRPLFNQIAIEFLEFLQHSAALPEDMPYALELAEYEWLELKLEVAVAPELPEGVDTNGELLSGHPVLSPLAEVRCYQWPVHRIGPDWQPAEPEITALIVHRDRRDQVRFHLITPLLAQLLLNLAEQEHASADAVLAELAAAIGLPQEQLRAPAGQGLEQLRAKGVILGTLPAA